MFTYILLIEIFQVDKQLLKIEKQQNHEHFRISSDLEKSLIIATNNGKFLMGLVNHDGKIFEKLLCVFF